MTVRVEAVLDEEVPLTGGDVTDGLVRAGSTVRRPTGRHTPAVHELLSHLERAGFDGAPRAMGIDERGREVLSWLPGETGVAFGDEAVAGVARLLRRYHTAVAPFGPATGLPWDTFATSNVDDEPELVGHCDVTPQNVVFRDGVPYALIDFDLARPTTRLFDVVNTLRWWAPLDNGSLPAAEVGRRMRLFCDAYGLADADRRRLLPVARLRFDRSHDGMRRRAETLGGGWARMWRDGVGLRTLQSRDWLDRNWDELDARLHRPQ